MAGRFFVHQFQLVHYEISGGLSLVLHNPSVCLIFLKMMWQHVAEYDVAELVVDRLIAVDGYRVDGKLCPMRPALEITVGTVELHLTDAKLTKRSGEIPAWRRDYW